MLQEPIGNPTHETNLIEICIEQIDIVLRYNNKYSKLHSRLAQKFLINFRQYNEIKSGSNEEADPL